MDNLMVIDMYFGICVNNEIELFEILYLNFIVEVIKID